MVWNFHNHIFMIKKIKTILLLLSLLLLLLFTKKALCQTLIKTTKNIFMIY